jgi:hypothetical protein
MNDDIQCPQEKEILRQMEQANKYEGGFAPRDMGSLIIMLSSHRKLCPFCLGVAADELFKAKVRVVV